MSRSPVAVEYRAGTEEEQALEERVVEHVEERGSQRERRAGGLLVGLKRQRQPEPDEDDADVLHRVVGEQPFQIVLHQRVEDAECRGHAAEHEHDEAGPPGRRADQVEDDPDEPVDGDLGHDAAHQRGDVARRGRVRERQPNMKRHKAGLRAGTDQCEHEDQRTDRGHGLAAADRIEGVASIRPGEEPEGKKQAERAEARHDEIDVAGSRIITLTMVRHHQRPRRERHELPGEQEGESVVGLHDEVHRRDEGRIERQHALRRALVTAVA